MTLVVACDLERGGTWEGAVQALRRGYGSVAAWVGPGAGPGNERLVELGAIAVDDVVGGAGAPVVPIPVTPPRPGSAAARAVGRERRIVRRRYPRRVIVDEPVRGSFAYLEQPGLFALPGVEQLRLFIERKLPAPPLTHLSGLVVEEADARRLHVVDPREPVVADGRRACSAAARSRSWRTPPSPARSSRRCPKGWPSCRRTSR